VPDCPQREAFATLPFSADLAFALPRVFDSQRRLLQGLPLGLDAKDCLDHTTSDHEGRTEEIAKRDLGDVSRPGGVLDQGTEEQRPAIPPATVPTA